MASVIKEKALSKIDMVKAKDTYGMQYWYIKKIDEPSEENVAQYNKYDKLFNSLYNHSWFDSIYAIHRWGDYLFPNKQSQKEDLVIKIFLDCVSRSDKDPMKVRRYENIYGDWKETGVEWVFKGYVYIIKGIHSDDEARLLILEDFDKERRYFEKLKIKFDETKESESVNERPRIPENVRIEVWRRDGGKCARCGSREKLEYDHIVPISRGGSNTARNIELLCEKCNRSKSNNVV